MAVVNPTAEDVKVIECCVSLFLKTRNGPARDMMSRSIRVILNRYGITRLELEKFSVRATGAKNAVVEGRDWIWTADRVCPGCEAPIYPGGGQVIILSVREDQPEGFDEVSYGCKCGRIFRKLEQNED